MSKYKILPSGWQYYPVQRPIPHPVSSFKRKRNKKIDLLTAHSWEVHSSDFMHIFLSITEILLTAFKTALAVRCDCDFVVENDLSLLLKF